MNGIGDDPARELLLSEQQVHQRPTLLRRRAELAEVRAPGTGVVARKTPAAAKQAQIAMILGALAILVGVFFFTLNIASM